MALEIVVGLSGIYYDYRLPPHMINLIGENMVLEKIIEHKEVNFTKISYLCNAIRAPCCLGK